MPSRYSNLLFYPPPSNLTHSPLISARKLWGPQQQPKHSPWILTTPMLKNLLFIPLAHLTIKRVMRKELSPHARRNRPIEEIRVISSAIPEQMAKLGLPARPGHVRYDPALIV